MFNARKSLMFVCFILLLVAPLMVAAAPGQEVLPGGDVVEGDALGLLAPIGDIIANVVVYVVAAAIFLFGTVQGTQIAKIFLPKTSWDWWLNARPYVIRGVSFVFAIWAMVGLQFDAFGILATVNDTFSVDPVFGQFLSGAALSYGANWYYDNKMD